MSDHDTVHRDDAPAAALRDNSDRADASRDKVATGDQVTARSVTIARPRQELYDYFRDFQNLPTFMENIVRVEVRDEKRSHWVVKAPAGATVEWDSEITQENPGSEFAWTSKGDIANSGHVAFRDAGDRGTIVTATIAYDPPAGMIGKAMAKLFGREPAIQSRHDLRRLKQLMETGEISTGARNAALAEEE